MKNSPVSINLRRGGEKEVVLSLSSFDRWEGEEESVNYKLITVGRAVRRRGGRLLARTLKVQQTLLHPGTRVFVSPRRRAIRSPLPATLSLSLLPSLLGRPTLAPAAIGAGMVEGVDYDEVPKPGKRCPNLGAIRL